MLSAVGDAATAGGCAVDNHLIGELLGAACVHDACSGESARVRDLGNLNTSKCLLFGEMHI